MKKLILILCLLFTSTAQAQFMPPLPAPFIPKPIMRKFLPAMAQRHRWQKKPIELQEFHITYDPYSPHDARWMKQFKQDLETPWSETILKTNAYHNASSQGKEAWIHWASKMDKRVKEIREQVKIHKHESTKLAYCVNSKYGPWVDLPRGKQPYPLFWLRLVEYHYQDYSWEDHEKYYEHSLQDMREAIWQAYFDKWVVEWAKKKHFTTRPQDINATDFSVQFYGLPNYYGYGTFYSNCEYCLDDGCNEWCLEEEGFKPPAIADKPKPKKLTDPETFMLLGEDNE